MDPRPASTRDRRVPAWALAACALALAWLAAGLLAGSTRSSGGGWARWVALPSLGGAVWLFLMRLRRAARAPETGSPGFGQKVVLGLALLSLLAGANAYKQFDGILAGIHLPGDAAHGASFLTGKQEIQTAVLTWDAFDRSETALEPTARAFVDPDPPMTMIAWAFGVYLALLLPAYAALIAVLALWILRGLERRRPQIALSAQEDRVDALKRIGSLTLVLLAVGVTADAAGNWLALSLTRAAWFDRAAGGLPHVSSALGALLSLISVVKVVAAIGIAGYLVVVGLFLARHADATAEKWTGARGIFQSVLAVRVQILATLVLVLLLVQEQVPDAIRRWSDDPGPMAWGLVFTILLALGSWHSSRWLLAYADPGPQDGSWRLTFAFTALALVGVVAFSLPEGWAPHPLAIAALVFLVMWHLVHAFAARSSPPPAQERPGWGRGVLPQFLAAATFALVGLALLRAGPGDFVYGTLRGEPTGQAALRTALGLLLLCAAGISYPILKGLAARHLPSQRTLSLVWMPQAVALITVIAWLVMAWVLSRAVVDVAPALGVVGVLTSFLLLAMYAASSLVASANRLVRYAPPVLRELGFRRVPVLSLVVVWALIASALGGAGRMHDVLARGTGTEPRRGVSLDAAFDRWIANNCLSPGSAPTSGPRILPAVPLILVASAGGGIRAAVWTTKVMERAIGFDSPGSCASQGSFPSGPLATRSNWVFAMSGVSGGALGETTYAAELPSGPPLEGGNEWIRDRLGGDFLSPPLAWMLYMETPWSLFRFSADRDRAAVLEQSWEEAWPETDPGLRQGLFDFQARHPHVPWLVLNGTTVESGCRFTASSLALSGRAPHGTTGGCLSSEGLTSTSGVLGASVDLAGFLCRDQDVSLAKAALLSARFPLVSPAGHLEQCGPRPEETFVVDGGYLENSGASAALGLWSALQPRVEAHNSDPRARACIVPFMIQIDNRYEDPIAAGTVPAPSQLTAPIKAFRATREGRTAEARQDAQLAFSRPFQSRGVRFLSSSGTDASLSNRYAHFTTLAHPGPKAPLGWALSSASFADLFDQARKNSGAERQVGSWFQGLSCTVRDTR